MHISRHAEDATNDVPEKLCEDIIFHIADTADDVLKIAIS